MRARCHTVIALGTQLFLPDWDLFGDVAFSQRVVPIGQVPSGGRAETEGHRPAPPAWPPLRFFKNLSRIETWRRRFKAAGIHRLGSTSNNDSRAGASATCQLRSTNSAARPTAVTFGDRALQFH